MTIANADVIHCDFLSSSDVYSRLAQLRPEVALD